MRTGILIVTAKRPRQLARCLASLPPLTPATVIVNGADAQSIAVINEYRRSAPHLDCMVFQEAQPKSRARNVGLERINADIIYCIDDDAVLPAGNIAIIEELFTRLPEIAAVSGPNLTPLDSSFFQRVSGQVFTSPFTAWRMRGRYSPVGSERASDDTLQVLCNLALRRDILIREGLRFDERLHYNEENLLLQQLMQRGYAMRYCPQLTVYHERRSTVVGLAVQIYGSGKGRAQMSVLMPATLKVAHLVPTIFIAYLLSLFLVGGWWRAPLFLYLILTAINAVYAAHPQREKFCAFLLMLILAPIAHLSYGWGFIRGLMDRSVWRQP